MSRIIISLNTFLFVCKFMGSSSNNLCQYTEGVADVVSSWCYVVGFPCFQLEGSFIRSVIKGWESNWRMSTLSCNQNIITLIEALFESLASYLVACWPLTCYLGGCLMVDVIGSCCHHRLLSLIHELRHPKKNIPFMISILTSFSGLVSLQILLASWISQFYRSLECSPNQESALVIYSRSLYIKKK